METPFEVERFPDALPLRDAGGDCVGLFSDWHSWLGVTLGETGELELWDLAPQELVRWELGLTPERVVTFADRLELVLPGGGEAWLGFAGPDVLVLQGHGGAPPGLRTPWPVRTRLVGGTWRLAFGPGAANAPSGEVFEENRLRWNRWFAAARAACAPSLERRDLVLLARALTTLVWNHCGARGELAHSGIVPSPFTYRGFWAWDSWKHAHALAHFAPDLAAEQLRVQFQRQRADGMVPDVVCPDSERDNWKNTKPPLAAWALEHLLRTTGDEDLAIELLPACALQMEWFERERRLPGEALFRAGGVDALTASWDTGWDESVRFEGIGLVEHGAWKLFDLWQPDYNAYCLNEYRALARLARGLGRDPRPWEEKASVLAEEIDAKLWDEELGAYVDVRPSDGRGTGVLSAAAWLPVWAGVGCEERVSRVRRMMTTSDMRDSRGQEIRSFDTEPPSPPLPALARPSAGFDPDGFWNGAVWIDQAAFGLATRWPSPGPRPLPRKRVHPSLDRCFDAMRVRLLGMLYRQASLYECYSSATGLPARGKRPATAQFSWTAAALLELLCGGPRPA